MPAVGVLGPLLVEGPAGPVPIGASRQRRLLVALSAHPGQVVSADLLGELVWDRGPGAPGAGALHTTVSRLRRLLPPGPRIVTAADGYQLVADRSAIDVTAFADELDAAGTDPDRYARALALWRGRPFAELDHPALHPEVARLVGLRAWAAERHGATLLGVGRAGEAVAALEALVVAEPLREAAVALLMRALVGAGRQGDALAAFARLRTGLADELGLDPSSELRALEQQVLRQEIPPTTVPTVSRSPTRGAVPRLPVSSFVGRDADVAAVVDLLGRRRVVTVCGPGGVGKTRLALHIAARVADRYDDGVLVVELGGGGPDDVGPAVAAALRLAAGEGALTERIVDVLAVRRQLLLLDNCEHVAEEAAVLVEGVAQGAPAVDVLLTSREPLRVDGEQVVTIAPLAPDAAVALLTDRLAAAGELAPDAELLPELCRRLDGLPLALELAAGRGATLGLPSLINALDEDGAIEVLRGGRRTAAPRHRSLADVVAWSHGLLDDAQRALFEQLAVFAGPVERAAVAAVCDEAGALPDLVQRSLVVRRPGRPDRFGMLDTLRAFGRAKLARDPRAAALRERHAAWAVGLADEIGADRCGPGEPAAVRRFDAHLPDLRRAHGRLCAHGPVDDLLRLSMLFGELAYVRGRVDLIRPVEDALAATRGGTPAEAPRAAHPLVPRLLGLLATSSWQRGDLDTAEARARHAVAVAEVSGHPTAGMAFGALAAVASFRGDLTASRQHCRRARELAREAGDVEVETRVLVHLAIVEAYAGDRVAADRAEAELAALAPALGSRTSRAWHAYTRGEIRAERGDPDAARHLAAAVRAAEEADSGFVAGIARHTLLTSAARHGDPAGALPAFGPLLDHWHGFDAWAQLWMAIRALVETLSRQQRHRDAAVLLGAMSASHRAGTVFGTDSARLDAVRDAARLTLGPELETAEREGAALGDQGALAFARRLTRSTRSR
ncbi:BTAD domain-containing putative transcriptional regulator [Pseudonocardia parietis]|uniref:ATPase/DNA-binding SARP family transcriptional activator n=1 Tax=Pseudonocardia parietis TaxID=570936 RepID=A0ABS4VWY6_9PSEU|nr:BTAD domain-containing putative transcriptional regulator [Pseudonocardia parietis]MBP2368461.1 putative ATPase/DNA-binding SARP family transcriptional activator [Pseudonocardia parietis]